MTPARRWLVASASVLIALGAFVWFRYLVPGYHHTVWRQRIIADIRSLEGKRPAGVSLERWQCEMTWLYNLHANCGFSPGFDTESHFDPVWRAGFAAEFERRLSGPITLADVEWFWDEYAAHTPNGWRYQANYGPNRCEGCPP